MRARTGAGALFVLLALLVLSCSPGGDTLEDLLPDAAGGHDASPAPGEAAPFVVESVVDGDTIEIDGRLHGADTVRLIGVDAPESADPDEGVEPMGKEAATFAREALEGETVELVADQEPLDPYGRALAYARLDSGLVFNSLLLSEGLAQVAIFPPNTAYEDVFYRHQATAKAEARGIWALPYSELCELADRGNGFGENSPNCGA